MLDTGELLYQRLGTLSVLLVQLPPKSSERHGPVLPPT